MGINKSSNLQPHRNSPTANMLGVIGMDIATPDSKVHNLGAKKSCRSAILLYPDFYDASSLGFSFASV